MQRGPNPCLPLLRSYANLTDCGNRQLLIDQELSLPNLQATYITWDIVAILLELAVAGQQRRLEEQRPLNFIQTR